MASFVVLEGPNRGATFQLLPERNRVGREGQGEVVLLDEAASRDHAEVVWDATARHFLLRDLGSKNGTHLNGLPAGEAPLRHGDEVRVGETVLLFSAGETLARFTRSGTSTLFLSAPTDAARSRDEPQALTAAPRIVGSSAVFKEVLTAAARAAPLDTPILLLGETGVGKELVALAIHRASTRCAGPLVSVNAAALAGPLCESELFGHERGAFTGAAARRAGCLERADGGTLFLDEVAELSLEAQAKLLRALETRRFTRLGGAQELESDFRLLAATNRDLDALVSEGAFRQDLLFRIDVVRLELPPLRERTDDVDLLAAHFVRTLAPRTRSGVRGIQSNVLERLRRHPFPGNVRELRNVIERALIFARGPELTLDDISASLRLPGANAGETDRPVVPLAELERDEIERALAATHGNKTQAALLLGIDRKTLYAKIDRHGLGR